VLKYGLLLVVAYFFMPEMVQKPIKSIGSSIWDGSRHVAKELGWGKLWNYGVDGVSESLKLVSEPDAPPHSPGTAFGYGPNPLQSHHDSIVEWNNRKIAAFEGPHSHWRAFHWARAESRATESFQLPWPSQDRPNFQLLEEAEALVQRYAVECDGVWVYCAELQIETQPHWVLILVDEIQQKTRALAFCFVASREAKPKLSKALVSVTQLEKLCGLKLFCFENAELLQGLYAEAPDWIW
jgi:hypothetical protein